MKYHVKVNTVTDRPDVWTGNAVEHDTAEAAEEAAKDLFFRWMAVKYWRVTDSDNNIIYSNKSQEGI